MPFLAAEHLMMTEAFINENPSPITIIRDTVTDDGAGGRVVSGETELAPQIMRLVGIEPQRGHTLVMLVTRDGEEVVANSTLIAMPDADIRRGDRFYMHDNDTVIYEILHVESHPEWRKRAEVYIHGGA
jgi:hypothetical protein